MPAMKAALAALLAATAAHALVAPVSRAGRRAPAPLREAKTEEKATEVQLLDVEVSDVDEFLIQWGLKEDPRVPEECRVDPMTRVKQSGKAGIAAYTITEFAFWLGSVPLAIAAVAYTTGSLPDVSSVEGKEAVAGYVFARARAGLLLLFFLRWNEGRTRGRARRARIARGRPKATSRAFRALASDRRRRGAARRPRPRRRSSSTSRASSCPRASPSPSRPGATGTSSRSTSRRRPTTSASSRSERRAAGSAKLPWGLYLLHVSEGRRGASRPMDARRRLRHALATRRITTNPNYIILP